MTERLSQIDQQSAAYQEVSGEDVQYPYLSFLAQIEFAQALSRVRNELLPYVLHIDTNLFFYMNGPHSTDIGIFREITHGMTAADDPKALANKFYSQYLTAVHSEYDRPAMFDKEGNYFDGPSYDYDPAMKVITRHFTAPNRTDRSPLSPENIPVQEENMRRMYTAIRRRHPDAKYVQGTSWLMSEPRYQHLLPAEAVTESIEIRPPELQYTSDMVWGQFIAANGKGHRPNYQRFSANLKRAQSEEAVITSFPYMVRKSRNPIEHYFKRYGVKA